MLKKIIFVILFLNGFFLYGLDIYWNGTLYNNYSVKDLNLISGGEFFKETGPISIPLWHLTPLSSQITELSSVRNMNRFESRGEELEAIFSSITLIRDNEGEWFLSWNKERLTLPEEIFLKGTPVEEKDLLVWLPPEMSWLKTDINIFSKTHRLNITVEIIEFIPESLSQRYLEEKPVPDAVFMSVLDCARYNDQLSPIPLPQESLNTIAHPFLNQILINQDILNKPGIPLFFSVYGIFTKKENNQIVEENRRVPVLAGNIYNPKWALLPGGLNKNITPQQFDAEKTVTFIQKGIESENFLLSEDPESLLKMNKTQAIIIESHLIKEIDSIVPFTPLWYPVISPYYLTFPLPPENNQSKEKPNQLLPFLAGYLANFTVQARTIPQKGFYPTNQSALALLTDDQSIATRAVSAVLNGKGKIIPPSKEWLQFYQRYSRIVGIMVNRQVKNKAIPLLYKELEGKD